MTLKFALVGCGRIVKKHIEALLNIPKAELVAVCDIIPEKAEKAASIAGVPWYTSYDEMLQKHPETDVVNILPLFVPLILLPLFVFISS